jgi:dTDP-4-dehydrorhamnose 3,5-epimerase
MLNMETGIPGLVLIEPSVFKDERGWFKEALNVGALRSLGVNLPEFVQLNHSSTLAHAARGLHFQAPPFAQAKYVRCLRGALIDVALDIRKGSPTYGQWYAATLTDENHAALYVPQGFAHGFYAVTSCELEYAVFGAGYSKAAEGGLRFTEETLGSRWTDEVLRLGRQWRDGPRLNARDASFPTLSGFESPFVYEGAEADAT